MFMCRWERSSTPDENWKCIREGRTAGGERERDEDTHVEELGSGRNADTHPSGLRDGPGAE